MAVILPEDLVRVNALPRDLEELRHGRDLLYKFSADSGYASAACGCGLWEGAMVRRHCIMNKDETAYMGLDDLKCGKNIEIYGRTYHIVGCDAFTRWYYVQSGIEVGEEVGF